MWKIRIKGEAKTTTPNLEIVDGIDCQDNFAHYFDSDHTFKNNIKRGWLHFEVEGDKLYSLTDYTSDRQLTEDELKELADYTQGQWSDGIGEGFEQEPCAYEDNGEDIFISPWFYKQEIEIIQNEVN